MHHAARVVGLMALAAGILGWLAAHTEIFFADGLRYIDQARRLDQGDLLHGLLKAVDHPAYPVGVALAHRALGGEGPASWQQAAQGASIVSGVLLVIPLYLVALELFGARCAWLGVLLTYLVPLTGHVFADVLSESTFLLFWTWGLWGALRFLREGSFGWLPPTIGCAAMAYLSRPEGLLLPAALVATLALMPLLRSTRMNWPRWWGAVGFLVIGPAVLVGPYVAAKGGLGTKPAIARLLGTASKSAADAVERQRPLDPNQSTAKTYAVATKAMFEAVRDAVTIPLLPLALVGLWTWTPGAPRARVGLFLGVMGLAAALALVRLHATGGYCSPRHAMVLAIVLIPAAASGLDLVLRSARIPGRWLGLGEGRLAAGPAVWVLAIAALVAWNGSEMFAPINARYGGYREAGAWLATHVPEGQRVVDVTGWALYYGERPGYTFATLIEAPADPNARWVVVRETHLVGPWTYCARLRALVAGRKPVEVFPATARGDQARVFVYDRFAPPAQAAAGAVAGVRR
jgi:4-amino-4-deoxy-L-arabinose transferase-like glycosyltransferase